MKNYLQKILKASGIFVVYYFIQAVVFSLIYKQYCNLSFTSVLMYELSTVGGSTIELNMIIAGIKATQNILYAVTITIYATYVYTCYVNKPPKILLPPKLVIRRRANRMLCFGVLVGNKNKYALNNVECSLTFRFKKADGGKNNEHKLIETHTCVINYYRFSFLVKDTPSELMEAYISKDVDKVKDDEILVIVSGMGYANNKFYIKKTYKLSDIIIDNYNPDNAWVDIVNPFTHETIRKKLNWKLLYKEQEVGESERNNIINEICNMFKIRI